MVCFALIALPCQAVNIGGANVHSSRGETLDAYVPIQLEPGEHIDDGCLSVGDQNDYPEPDYPLLTAADLSLLAAKDAIRIKTNIPLDLFGISIAIRVRCADGPVTVRALNLYLPPPQARVAESEHTGFPDSIFTVRPGDSIFGLARTIYPENEKAVRKLALAIVLANPGLFPDGRFRPLQIGERLTMPDLRAVQGIVEDSEMTSESTIDRDWNSTNKPIPLSKMTQTPAPVSSRSERKRALDGSNVRSIKHPTAPAHARLQLKLSRSIDLSRSRGVTQARRNSMRQNISPAVTVDSTSASSLLLRIARIREAQDSIDAQLERLDSKLARLQQAAIASTTNALPLEQSPLTGTILQQVSSWWHRLHWLKWLIMAGVAILLLAVGFLLGRKPEVEPESADHETRISNILEEARAEAMPLLGPEPTLRNDDESVRPGEETVAKRGWDYSDDDESSTEIAGTFEEEAVQTVIDPPHYVPVLDSPSSTGLPSQYADYIDPSAPIGEVSQKLQREMDDALDGARSMFTDVDRFIGLGRTQNAISLLEFQIQRDSQDRDAWIKLMAIYKVEGMAGEFERTLAAFNGQFKDG